MKAESLNKPVSSFEVTFLKNDYIFIEFFENIEKKEREEIENINEKKDYYKYDYYQLKIKNRENILNDLKEKEANWLQIAKEKEISEKEIKLKELKQNIIDLSLEKEMLESTGYFSSSTIEAKLRKAIQEHSELSETIAAITT